MRYSHTLGRALGAAALSFVAATITAPTARAQGPDDATIVAIFDVANTWDMETGQLAVEKGSSQEVRDFGAMLVRDHRQVRQQGRDLAQKLHVTPTPPSNFALAAEHDAAMRRLRGLSGKAFDRAFLENEVAYHQAVIDAVTKTLLPSTKNAELKHLQEVVAPAFAAHRDASKNMLTKAN